MRDRASRRCRIDAKLEIQTLCPGDHLNPELSSKVERTLDLVMQLSNFRFAKKVLSDPPKSTVDYAAGVHRDDSNSLLNQDFWSAPAVIQLPLSLSLKVNPCAEAKRHLSTTLFSAAHVKVTLQPFVSGTINTHSSADLEFDRAQISHLRRMTAKRAATAASRSASKGRLWADLNISILFADKSSQNQIF